MPKKINPPNMPAPSNGIAGHEEVQRLAYEYWLARGCPEGSSEEDWFRAEQALHGVAQTEPSPQPAVTTE